MINEEQSSRLEPWDKPAMDSSLGPVSDEILLERYEAGDPAAFETLFLRYREKIFRFVLCFLRDKYATQDAVQDVFLKVICSPGKFQARSRFSTWLHAIAKNLCIDILRKNKRRNTHPLDFSNPSTWDKSQHKSMVSQEPLPEHKAYAGEVRLKILRAIRKLSDEQRVVFLLREIGGMPFSEIALELNIPPNTAKSRMRYALENLRKELPFGLRPL